MKPTTLILIVLLVMTFVVNVYAISGTVVVKESGCDSYIIQTPNGYALVESFGGNDPEKGDMISGEYQKYGFNDAYNVTADSETRVWVEDYALPKSEVVAKYAEKCN